MASSSISLRLKSSRDVRGVVLSEPGEESKSRYSRVVGRGDRGVYSSVVGERDRGAVA